MPRHIDANKRKQEHTFAAINAAKQYDWPCILLVIYYPGMATYDVAPSHYYIANGEVPRPVARKFVDSYKGMRLLFMPNRTMEEVWK